MKIIAGLMSLGLSGCSLAAYDRPVVMPPPGGGDPWTTVGATVRCRGNRWPIGLDLTATLVAGVVGAGAFVTTEFLAQFEPHDAPAVAVWFLPSALFFSSAVYGVTRSARCRRALAASARVKLRGEPLHLEGVRYESPANPRTPPRRGGLRHPGLLRASRRCRRRGRSARVRLVHAALRRGARRSVGLSRSEASPSADCCHALLRRACRWCSDRWADAERAGGGCPLFRRRHASRCLGSKRERGIADHSWQVPLVVGVLKPGQQRNCCCPSRGNRKQR